jgi:hypothetical protein
MGEAFPYQKLFWVSMMQHSHLVSEEGKGTPRGGSCGGFDLEFGGELTLRRTHLLSLSSFKACYESWYKG